MPEVIDFREGVETITKLVSKLADQFPTPVALIDGRAGAGKSSFATSLQNSLFKELEQAPRLVSMDDLYPGWEGLAAGSRYLESQILKPLQDLGMATWQVWDWQDGVRGNEDEVGNGWRTFDGGCPLIVEGCGSLSRLTQPLAHIRIWVEVPRDKRKSRFSSRDHGIFDAQWDMWAVQEDEFYQENKSDQLADYVIKN